MVAFPLEVRPNYYCVSPSQAPNFSERTEPTLRCRCLGCEYEKKKKGIAHFYPKNLKFNQNLVFKLPCFVLLVLHKQGYLTFTAT